MTVDASAVAAARRAIKLVCATLPHLSGLAHAVRISADGRVGTAGVFPSGRLLIKPEWFLELNDVERAFVLAHELLHLALHTHDRAIGCDHSKFNIAHDLIINDILETEFGITTPGGGVRHPGARHCSAEALMLDQSFAPESDEPPSVFAIALVGALGRRASPLETMPDDVLTAELEAIWFPNETSQQRAANITTIRIEGVKALSLQHIQQRARESAQAVSRLPGDWYSDAEYAYTEALAGAVRPPWELALHRWMDDITPRRRTYARASRRGADRTDIVLLGRDREGLTLSIVLDTSGSMTDEIEHALGSIMAFGRQTAIEAVRIVQCDTAITVDEVVDIDSLARYRVAGFGGSDMSPAMNLLADDAEATAVIVITDGCIQYPPTPLPYDVLWMVYGHDDFAPPYGQVIRASMTEI